jgi:hypothetical protein
MKRLPGFASSGELQSLSNVLDEALLLLEGHRASIDTGTSVAAIQPSLFEQCIALCRQVREREPEPIRTIHHLSCTGGTLITKCLAAMPNVMVLNEIDPLSNMQFNPEKPAFSPTDMLALVRQGDNQASEKLLIQMFVQNLKVLRSELALVGKRLLLRDHSHSHFLTESDLRRTSVLSMVAEHFSSTRSILTVRNPVDSFLSLEAQGWKTFYPFTLDEYSKRYLHFLDVHAGIPIFRYEDFVNEPAIRMEQMCDALRLAYSANFTDTFDAFRFSGDSGRTGITIRPRVRRSYDEAFVEEAQTSVSYRLLIKRLGYDSIC